LQLHWRPVLDQALPSLVYEHHIKAEASGWNDEKESATLFHVPAGRFFPLTYGWRRIHRDIYQVNLDGIRFRFWDPGGPEGYWKYFFYNTFFRGTLYEHSVVLHLRQAAKGFDSPTFVDAGAHYGYFSVCMSILGGPTSKVYSLEPNGEYFKILSANVALNKLRNVALHRIALADHIGMVTLGYSKYSPTLSREKRKMEYSEDPAGERIVAVPFDSVAQSEGVSPNIVKIDVRGAEGNVVAGMKKSLRKVSHLYCELHQEMLSYGYHPKDIVGILEDSGLETFEFRGFRRENARLTKISGELLSNPEGRMIYARRR
jgi:FkbM family methyltransferase